MEPPPLSFLFFSPPPFSCSQHVQFKAAWFFSPYGGAYGYANDSADGVWPTSMSSSQCFFQMDISFAYFKQIMWMTNWSSQEFFQPIPVSTRCQVLGMRDDFLWHSSLCGIKNLEWCVVFHCNVASHLIHKIIEKIKINKIKNISALGGSSYYKLMCACHFTKSCGVHRRLACQCGRKIFWRLAMSDLPASAISNLRATARVIPLRARLYCHVTTVFRYF